MGWLDLVQGLALMERLAPVANGTGGQSVHMDRAVCGSTFVGSFYFGHWLADDLP